MGKTGSDIASTQTFDSPEQYAAAQAQKASSMATVQDEIKTQGDIP